MNNLWLKIKVWTKGILAALVLLYLIFFVANNSGQTVKFWLFFGNEIETSLLVFAFVTFFGGVLVALLVRALLNTLRQIRELREKNRAARLERQVNEMQAKAARLKTRDTGTTTSATGEGI